MSKISYIILIILYVSLNIKPNFSQTCGLSSNQINIDSSREDSSEADHSTIPLNSVRINLSGKSSNKKPKTSGSRIGNRILSGGSYIKTSKTEFSWIIQIHKKSSFAELLCAGSLINENVVLTAGHCLNTVKANSIEVRAGIKYSLIGGKDDDEPEIRNVTSIVIHKNFNARSLLNDIGLAFLELPLSFTKTISSVCIPPENTNFDNKLCFVSGWGLSATNHPGGVNELKTVDVPVLPSSKCLAALRQTSLGPKFHLHSSFMCAGGEVGKDACNGDGGSPLMCLIDGTDDIYYQAGIVSWGMGCGVRGIPGVYTNVAAFKSWIDKNMMDKGLSRNTYTYNN